MSCAACAKRVEKVVGKVGGVLSVSVNFATEKATVSYDPRMAKLSAIRAAIEGAGYEALDAQKSGAVDEDKIRKEAEIRALRRKFTVAAVFGVPLLYLAMVSMIWWLRAWLPFPKILDPMQYPLHYILAQLVLVIPILIAGRNFYKGSRRSFREAPIWIR